MIDKFDGLFTRVSKFEPVIPPLAGGKSGRFESASKDYNGSTQG